MKPPPRARRHTHPRPKVRCFVQQRWLNLDPLTRDKLYPSYAKYMADHVGVCEWLAEAAHVTVAEAKRLVIVVTNMGAQSAMDQAGSFLDAMLNETCAMMKMEHLRHPGPRPIVSMMAALDWDREARTTNKIDSVHFSSEWDGIVAFVVPGTESSYCDEMMRPLGQ